MANDSVLHIEIPQNLDPLTFTGEADSNLRRIQDAFDVAITLHENDVALAGDDTAIEHASRVVSEILRRKNSAEPLDTAELDRLITIAREGSMTPSSLHDDIILSHRGRAIRPKTAGQKRFIDAIRNNTITFGLGPAGTGKTFLSCALAVAALNNHEVARIVLTRPIVEAGESLGFLPGTLMEKVDPYMRPLYDALFELIDTERVSRYLEDGTIEITPLAFMRGRTFSDSFVILDEAQNTTSEQMKMFLTRLGFGSKMVIAGDASQSDTQMGSSVLRSARNRLKDIDDIAFCELKGSDVVRNSLVAQIISAYEKHPTDSEG